MHRGWRISTWPEIVWTRDLPAPSGASGSFELSLGAKKNSSRWLSLYLSVLLLMQQTNWFVILFGLVSVFLGVLGARSAVSRLVSQLAEEEKWWIPLPTQDNGFGWQKTAFHCVLLSLSGHSIIRTAVNSSIVRRGARATSKITVRWSSEENPYIKHL